MDEGRSITQEDLAPTFKWIADQKKKFAKMPVEEIDPKAYALVEDIERYAILKNRELAAEEIV